jgi:hypothetical protein
MAKYKVEVNAGSDQADHIGHEDHAHTDAHEHESVRDGDDFTSKAATVGVVVVGAALLEAALIPGIVLGAAAVLAPKYLPKLRDRLQPLWHSTVRGAYILGRKARSAVGEVKEHMSDIAAEVHAEEIAKAGETAPISGGAKA